MTHERLQEAWELMADPPGTFTADILRTMADAVINLASSIDMLEEAVEAVERGEEPCPPSTSGTSSNG